MRGKAGIPLLRQLKIIDPNVQTEVKFDWLFLPKSNERTGQEDKIIKALWEDCQVRGESKFKNKKCSYEDIYVNDSSIKGVSRKLEFDFYLPKYNVAIELDENQHFTIERGITFDFYKKENFIFDISEWKNRCFKLKKKDSDPLTRDWKRAFRDAIRDIRARENKLPLLRLYIKNADDKAFEDKENILNLKESIKQASSNKYLCQ